MKERAIGLDIGIDSVGACVVTLNDGICCEIIEPSSYTFSQSESPKTGVTESMQRGQKRRMRRQVDRKKLRLSDARELFKNRLGVDFDELMKTNKNIVSPAELKVKGLTEKLTKEELSIALYNYLKYRGYKSNRKVDDESDKDVSDRKVLSGIAALRDEIGKREESGEKVYVSQILAERMAKMPKELRHFHNRPDEFTLTVPRDLWLEEIKAVLDKQKSFGVIDEEFKNEYVSLFSRQRDFSEGPGNPSPFADPIDRMIGTCEFDGERRAPKSSASASKFILLSSLRNLSYRMAPGEKYKHFDSEQIRVLEKYALGKKETTYASLFSELGIEPYEVAGLFLSKKEYFDALSAVRAKKSDGESEETPEWHAKVRAAVCKKTLDRAFFKNSEFVYDLRKSLSKIGGDDIAALRESDDFYDDVASILISCKTDQRILAECQKRGYPQKAVDEIIKQKNVTETVALSLPICKKLIPLIESGLRYDEAMEKIGYKHSDKGHAETIGIFPPADVMFKECHIQNVSPAVKKAVIKALLVFSAADKKFGRFGSVGIEVARDLKKSFDERRKIVYAQMDRKNDNIDAKTEIMRKYPTKFRSISSVKKTDVIRYRLFEEQNGVNPYTGKPIDESEIFDDNLYQIDHIVPYSKSFDDSFDNKVLVGAKDNQEKGNRLPLGYLSDGSRLREFVASNDGISREKASRLLATEIPDGMAGSALTDTASAALIVKQLIEYYYLPAGKKCRCISGAMTAIMRKLYGLSGKTTSFRSSSEKGYAAKFLSDYAFDSFDVGSDGKSVTFRFVLQERETVEFEIKKRISRGKQTDSVADSFNDALSFFIENEAYFKDRFHFAYHKQINELYPTINYESDNAESQKRRESGEAILGEVFKAISDDINKKDRGNDLHHAVDATLIAIATEEENNRIKHYFQENENRLDSTTGEIKPEIPFELPYPDFTKDVLVRIYERDQEKQTRLLSSLAPYDANPDLLKIAHVMLPARSPEKGTSGALFKETILGKDEKTGLATKRVLVEKLSLEDAESIVDKDGGNHAVYEACKLWLATPKDSRAKYPMLAKKGTIVRRVRLLTTMPTSKIADLPNDGYAENAECARVDVYQKKDGSGKLGFVAVYRWQLKREKLRSRQLEAIKTGRLSVDKLSKEAKYTMMWGRNDDQQILLTKKELESDYVLKAHLPRYSLIELHLGEKSCLCYSGGVTCGQLDVYSVIGDCSDLIDAGFMGTLGNDKKSKCRVQLSMITDLKVRSISMIGDVS
jgi:CRISPR-associated endonuclease Csn1